MSRRSERGISIFIGHKSYAPLQRITQPGMYSKHFPQFDAAADRRMERVMRRQKDARAIWNKWLATNRIFGVVLAHRPANYQTAYEMIGVQLNLPWPTARTLAQG